jgi:hypothetical protein
MHSPMLAMRSMFRPGLSFLPCSRPRRAIQAIAAAL